jgi:hypothetical protein
VDFVRVLKSSLSFCLFLSVASDMSSDMPDPISMSGRQALPATHRYAQLTAGLLNFKKNKHFKMFFANRRRCTTLSGVPSLTSVTGTITVTGELILHDYGTRLFE